MKDDLSGVTSLIGPLALISILADISGIDTDDDPCMTMGRGYDSNNPLWNAPGMPGYTSPPNDPFDPNFGKEPKDYKNWSKMKKFWWQARKWGAKIFGGPFYNP